ncbi:MAG TPA: NADP-dependent isocitrate dehydrogenase [Acidobacteriota bacterium]|jgi:isocitrate dehydrogenase|nr:NADP-dependent isocitrate dehydrogenase [Acidobacteriota bacterium]
MSRSGKETFLVLPATTEPRAEGSLIKMENGKLVVPDHPEIPFIEGDGTGPDIWRATCRVLDAAVERAYGKRRSIRWMEVLAGEKAFLEQGEWLPDETVSAFSSHLIGMKGPLTTPVGGGIRSLNVTLRRLLDLYVCLRPVRYFEGAPSPVKHPEKVDIALFRENTEDTYTGIEWKSGSPAAKRFMDFIAVEMGEGAIMHPETTGIGVKPVSEQGSKRLCRAAIRHALKNGRRCLDIAHKGNIMKFTEGAFKEWGYEVAVNEFRQDVVTKRELRVLRNKDQNSLLTVEENAKMLEPGIGMFDPERKEEVLREVRRALDLMPTHGGGKWAEKLLVKDAIVDVMMEQVLTRPEKFDVIAAMNLNGDYLADALAAQVGGTGIAPGANINYETGHAIFEATHGTAPKYAGLDIVNPTALILSGEMMLRHVGWEEAAELVIRGIERAIGSRTVTYDFARPMISEGIANVKEVKCSEFGDAVVTAMKN